MEVSDGINIVLRCFTCTCYNSMQCLACSHFGSMDKASQVVMKYAIDRYFGESCDLSIKEDNYNHVLDFSAMKEDCNE